MSLFTSRSKLPVKKADGITPAPSKLIMVKRPEPQEIPELYGDFDEKTWLEYCRLGASIDFQPAAALRAELLLLLKSSGIKIYEKEAVFLYLQACDFLVSQPEPRKIIPDDGVQKKQPVSWRGWGWMALRPKDLNARTFSFPDEHTHNRTYSHGYFSGAGSPHYSDIVPRKVLETAVLLAKKFDIRINFFVSLYISRRTIDDPAFIIVRGDNMQPIIFGHWNGPDFAEIPSEEVA
ncbi:MAG: hypothetical protein HYW89_01090 [Candidatus Sungiibacteriota bacterium]|uniref:Uncharacterized protein n=1 Tax=Candidatus Sungiibacteriota bacterium TaxID=2750080 RepID=A0A7T5RJV9_9BACT|nr:MAG: hypothetical protein HYW89_01090 [Candidatus Sungbacteria bacterium]